MRLTDLLAKCDAEIQLIGGDAQREVEGITADSRRAGKGVLFCAIAGASEDGARYIEDAIGKGAAAILISPSLNTPEFREALNQMPRGKELVLLESSHPRLAYAKLCAAFWPQQPRYCVAVTGTNGKTSVAEFYRQICAHAGRASASIGTLGLTRSDGSADAKWPSENTSPAPEIVHAALDRLAREGVQHVALEASSHGLHQYRLHGVRLAATAFTNLTQDHLDYHKDMEDYFQAKARLFSDFDAPCVINADNDYGQRLLQMFLKAKSYGLKGDWLRLESVTPTPEGLSFVLRHEGQTNTFDVPLYGAFQVENILAASGLALLTGIVFEALAAAIPSLKGARGRMEKVAQHPCGAPVFIDYAHTPDALKHLLISLRPHCEQKLHVVFGCGGDRDTTKRAPMGSIAAEFADRVIVTDDNPRTEDAQSIRRQIVAHAPRAIEIADRAQAISQAIKEVQAGDLLVVAGKGHETYQIIGETKHDFNDAHIIKEALGAL